ncbi:MAG: tetratricopeptide repeat protein [Parachlamydiaceae bacterium]|nr:MAG: tetratricopeptide repeat protein [Parachlamydiaceae bacterium]
MTDWEARLEYARLLSNLHRYEEALTQLNKLLKEKPDSSLVLIEVAKIYYYEGKNIEALQILEKLPAKDVDNKTKLLMADINLALKKYPIAESLYRKQLENEPTDDLTKFKLAELLSWEKRYEESIQLYREILASRPEDIQIRRKYAMVLFGWVKRKLQPKSLKNFIG